jgi:divalent metal cation (Fe/Co/Zn/Cd) transporter
MYGNVCTASNWWVTTVIDVIFVMILVALALWIVKLFTGIYANSSSAKAKS